MWLVPGAPEADSVKLWLGALDVQPSEEARIAVRAGGRSWQSKLNCAWRERRFGGVHIWSARSGLTGLAPDTQYELTLLDDQGGAHDAIKVRTLPSTIPTRLERPLVVWLGSCFSAQRDSGAGVLRATQRLGGPDLPHVKVFCGDQVYIDLPVMEWLPANSARLRERLVAKYLRHWAPARDSRHAGFGALLRQGANLFVSDDHEFWNNFPFTQAHLKHTWREAGRDDLEAACRDLLHTFQFPGEPADGPPLQQLRVGGADGFELRCLDGRAARTAEHAHDPDQLAATCQWLRNLKSPAALVLSQPLFEDRQPTRFGAKVKDAGLADMPDYDQLTSALAAAPHDVLILSGDIHGGRVARAQLSNGRQLFEVVSSPLGLIKPGDYHAQPAHSRFPAQGAALARVEMRSRPVTSDQFATISFWRTGGALQVKTEFRTMNGPLDHASHEFSLI